MTGPAARSSFHRERKNLRQVCARMNRWTNKYQGIAGRKRAIRICNTDAMTRSAHSSLVEGALEKKTPRDDSSARAMIAKACGVVGAALTSDAHAPEQWLKQICTQLFELLEGRAAAIACVREASAFEGEPTILYAGAAGKLSRDALEAVLAELATCEIGARAVSRSQTVSDRVWQLSGSRRSRAAHGLFEFARAGAEIELVDGRGLLAIELNGLSAQWKPDDLTLAAMEAVAPAMARGFTKRFIEPERRRHALLERLSDTQKLIVPLLAAGCTEREVAERIERSAHTVHEHTREIYRAFGVRSRMEMRDLWLGLNLPPPGAGTGSEVTIRRGSPVARTGSARDAGE